MDDHDLLMAERACARLVTQYCHFIDHGAAGRVAELFAVDGVWSSTERVMTGQAEIARGFEARERNAGRRSRHVCGNLLLDLEGPAHAAGVTYLTLYRHDGEADLQIAPLEGPVLVGEYRDRFVRSDAGWRIQRREVVVSFVRAG